MYSHASAVCVRLPVCGPGSKFEDVPVINVNFNINNCVRRSEFKLPVLAVRVDSGQRRIDSDAADAFVAA